MCKYIHCIIPPRTASHCIVWPTFMMNLEPKPHHYHHAMAEVKVWDVIHTVSACSCPGPHWVTGSVTFVDNLLVCICFNYCHAEFILGNMEIYLNFLSIFTIGWYGTWKSSPSWKSILHSQCHGSWWRKVPVGWFNIKMSSYQYRKSHCGDKTILRPSYLHNWISYTGKTTSLYKSGPRASAVMVLTLFSQNMILRWAVWDYAL